MLQSISLYLAFAKVRFMTQLEYRFDYAMRTLSKIVGWGSGFVTIMVVLSKFKAMGSWSLYEVLFVYALNTLGYAIGATFMYAPFNGLSNNIVNGTLDSILTKPVNPLVFYICQNVSAGYTSNYVMGLGIMLFCVAKLGIVMTVGNIALLFVIILCASVIHGAMFMICSLPAFWILKSKSIFRLFYWNGRNMIDYPISIYAKGIQVVLTFLLPYGFVNYYPSTLFFHKEEYLFNPMLSYLTPLVAVVLALAAYGLWLLGLKSYNSTGS